MAWHGLVLCHAPSNDALPPTRNGFSEIGEQRHEKQTFFLISTFLIVSTLFLPNSFAQDYTQWLLPEGAKARLGKGSVGAIVHSPDGTRIAVATYSGTWLYDAQTGEELNLFWGSNAVFSPDSRMLALDNGFISLRDAETGNLIRTTERIRWGTNSIAFSPEGQTFATAGRDGIISLWDVQTGNPIRTFTGDTTSVIDVAFSPEGQTLASAGGDHTISLWEVETGNLLHKLTGHIRYARAVVFSPEGETLASAGTDDIHLWDVETGSLLRTLPDSRSNIIAFSPEGETLVTGKYVWDVSTGNLIREFTEHTHGIISLMLSADGQTLTGGDSDGAIHSWDFGTGNLLRTLKVGLYINSVAFSADGQTLTSVGSDGIHLWNPGGANFLRTITEDEISGGVFSPDRTTIAGYTEGTVRLLEAGTGRLIRTLSPQSLYGTNAAFSPDGQTLATAGRDGIRLWDVETGSRIIWDTETGSRILWDTETGCRTLSDDVTRCPSRVRHALTGRSTESVAFSPDGQTLASAGGYGIHLWDAGTGNLLRTLTRYAGYGGSGGFIAFSPDGQTLATVYDGSGLLWDVTPAPSEPEKFTADVNGDGEVNIQDLVAVAAALGEAGETPADVNGDGEVNIQDLVAVAAAIGQAAAAPAAIRQQATAQLTTEDVQHWLTQARQLNLTDARTQRGILFLAQLLSALTPKETTLLANYPNPFNPETWIPYQLAKPADVRVSIYAVDGTLVRTLDLGHQPIGIYQARSRAAYWDGRNAVGESVASGVYFYSLTAGDFTATRKMLIRK